MEIKKLYQKTLERGACCDVRPSPGLSQRERGECEKTIMDLCEKSATVDESKMAYCEEYESRLRPTESADVAAGVGVTKR